MRKISDPNWDKFIGELERILPRINVCTGKRYVDALGIYSLNILPYRPSSKPYRKFFRLPLAGLIMRDGSISIWQYQNSDTLVKIIAQITKNLLKEMELNIPLEIITGL